MPRIIRTDSSLEKIGLDRLLTRSLELKKGGYRLGQISVAYVNKKFELSYSFENDGDLHLINLRIIIDIDQVVPTITEIFPYATFYENEIKELFGVNVELINLDYKNKLYRIDRETPFLPEGAKEELAAQRAAEETEKEAEQNV